MSQLSHHCDGLVLICMDWRLFADTKTLEQVKGLAGVKNADLLAIAGGTKNLVELDNQELVLSHLNLCQNLHQGKKVILTNHTDCGAYGEAGTEEKLVNDLKRGREIIQEKCPGLETILVLIKLSAGDNDWQTECRVID